MDVKDKASGGVAPDKGKITIDKITESADEPGTYTATLSGTQAGEWYLTAQLSNVAITGLASQKVTLKVGKPDGSISTISASPKSVPADNETTSTLTLTLADEFGNVVTDAVDKLGLKVTDSKGTTVDESKYTLTAWVEDQGTPGMYTAAIKSFLADTLTVQPMYDDLELNGLNADVEFVSGEFKNVTVNGHTFAIDDGFPSAGFDNAMFTLNVPDGKTVSDYTWTSNQNWASVNSTGKVTFSSTPSSGANTVTIVATPNTTGLTLTYTITANIWYRSTMNNVTYSAGVSFCSDGTVPAFSQVTSGPDIRGMGSLWSEWGPMAIYGPEWNYFNWTSTVKSSNPLVYKTVRMSDGGESSYAAESAGDHGLCRIVL